MTRKPRPAPFDGALVIDKPRGRTSHDVVDAVRRLLGFRQVGHLGTLDPLATGVLVLLLGRATRFAQFYAGRRKRYRSHVPLRFCDRHLRCRWHGARDPTPRRALDRAANRAPRRSV